MRKILALSIIALVGCAASKPASVAESNWNALKKKQCEQILNAPDFIREVLKDLTPSQVRFHENDTITTQTCKTLETIICNGVEYRIYDLCFPARRVIFNLLTEEDVL